MKKSIYEKALDDLSLLVKQAKVINQVQNQDKLLKLYEKLADHRLRVIHYLLDEITDLEHFDTAKEFIDYITYEVKYYGDEDTKIDEEIAKIRLEIEK